MSAWLWLVAVAEAADYPITLCVQITVADFLDAEWGDHWNGTDGEFQPIRGIEVNITEHSRATGIYRRTMYFGPTSEVDGCVLLSLSGDYDYQIGAWSVAEVNGVPIEAKDTGANITWIRNGPSNRYHPTGATTLFLRPAYEPALGEMAVGTYAMSLSNAGLGPNTPLIYSATECCNGSNHAFIWAASARKEVIGHETGHGVGKLRDGNQPPVVDYDRDLDHCVADPWSGGAQGRFEKEWQSAAVKEGWADFFAAWLFNDPTESDCEYSARASVDVDQDGSEGDFVTHLPDAESDLDVVIVPGVVDFVAIGCEGIPLSSGLRSYVTARDYLEDLVAAGDQFGATGDGFYDCNGTLEGVGTEFDVQRYFWDMLTDEGVPFDDLVDLYDLSDPRDWSATKETSQAHLAENPFRRLEAAADQLSLGAEHDAQKDNGVDHGP